MTNSQYILLKKLTKSHFCFIIYNMVKSCEAVFVAKCAALGSRPRSPMMTKAGIVAEGLSADEKSRRLAAENVSPVLTAVF